MKFAAPCPNCGEPTKNRLCDTCKTYRTKLRDRDRNRRPKVSAQARGYGHRWQQLSAKARKLQPFCSDCDATNDLQCDHTPEAWERHERGLAIRLQDIDVVCGPCNRRRGAARGKGSQRRSNVSKSPE